MKNLSLILLFVFSAIILKSQDYIILHNGEEIESVVLEIDTISIKYKKFNFQNGPTYVIKKDEVFMITYKNGDREIFKKKLPEEEPIEINKSIKKKPDKTYYSDYCHKAYNDALDNYKCGGAPAGTFIATIIFSPIGLITAAVCSSTPPMESTLNIVNNQDYYNSEEYQFCYKEKAKKIKQRKVWTAFGIGIAFNFAVAIYILTMY